MRKKVATLKNLVIEMCYNSEKTSNMSKKSRSILRCIRKKNSKNKRYQTKGKKKLIEKEVQLQQRTVMKRK